MGQSLSFKKLNTDWNANPDVPFPRCQVLGKDLLLRFRLNYHIYAEFSDGDIGMLRFRNCSRFRLGPTNDEGWYLGQCRYGRRAPEWGEFYELIGEDPLLFDPPGWQPLSAVRLEGRHFLFYLRDDTFECIAEDWDFEVVKP